MYIYTIPGIILFVFIFAFTKPFKSSMKPRGGIRIKNFIAWLMIRLGSQLEENRRSLELINQRVPVPEEKDEEDYNDSFVFEGSDKAGNLFMTRLGFRNGGRQAEVWLWLTLDENKYSIPVDRVDLTPEKDTLIKAGGLTYTCLDPQKGTWRIQYEGPLEPGIENCSLDLTYEPVSELYHSGIHMNAMTFARSMAEMPWSREYFQRLRSENQCRIEQGGRLKGSIQLNGAERSIDMLSIRDHSWGKRNWTYINRYIWNILSFEDDILINNKKYRYCVYTTVNYGINFRHLVSGWIGGPDSVLPIVKASDMTELGEEGAIPGEFTTSFQAEGGPVMQLKVRRSPVEHSWFTQEQRFEICEAACSIELDGIRGHGMSEFGYSKDGGYKRDFP